MVVTKTVKILAWIMVAILNLFFVYFALLRGLERGERWQRLYAGACALQLVIEIFVYEVSTSFLSQRYLHINSYNRVSYRHLNV